MRDQRKIEATFSNIKRLRTPVWIMSFAEGTRFTHQKLKEVSRNKNKEAKENN